MKKINLYRKYNYVGVIALICATIIWGSTFVATQPLLDNTGALTVTALRFSIGVIALLPLAYYQGFRLKMVFKKFFIVFGFTGITCYFGLQNLGLLYTSAGNASLIQAGIPAVTAILAFIILKEKLSPKKVIGIILSIFGVILVSSVVPESGDLFGNILIITSVISYGLYTVIGKLIRKNQYSAVVTTISGFVSGLLFLIPFVAIETLLIGLPIITINEWIILIYLGVIGSAATLFLWNYALKYVNASVAGVYVNLIPVVGLIFAWYFGESITLVQLTGIALVLLGVLISEIKTKKFINENIVG
ncbi:DMT family transporter [Salicibibacter kimchii]|uniref:DMT family transporter n=1 Tax=Salicibibacter kimchii TaxID=2099786 RepID=UPI001357E82A|nr:EamA family transporter [Salicibibacter kimchii]